MAAESTAVVAAERQRRRRIMIAVVVAASLLQGWLFYRWQMRVGKMERGWSFVGGSFDGVSLVELEDFCGVPPPSERPDPKARLSGHVLWTDWVELPTNETVQGVGWVGAWSADGRYHCTARFEIPLTLTYSFGQLYPFRHYKLKEGEPQLVEQLPPPPPAPPGAIALLPGQCYVRSFDPGVRSEKDRYVVQLPAGVEPHVDVDNVFEDMELTVHLDEPYFKRVVRYGLPAVRTAAVARHEIVVERTGWWPRPWPDQESNVSIYAYSIMVTWDVVHRRGYCLNSAPPPGAKTYRIQRRSSSPAGSSSNSSDGAASPAPLPSSATDNP